MFKPRPYDPSRKDGRSQAAKEASDRNFRIFKLRGLYAQVGLLTGKRRERARKIVDEELKAMGAETEGARIEARRMKIEREYASFNGEVDYEDPIS